MQSDRSPFALAAYYLKPVTMSPAPLARHHDAFAVQHAAAAGGRVHGKRARCARRERLLFQCLTVTALEQFRSCWTGNWLLKWGIHGERKRAAWNTTLQPMRFFASAASTALSPGPASVDPPLSSLAPPFISRSPFHLLLPGRVCLFLHRREKPSKMDFSTL